MDYQASITLVGVFVAITGTVDLMIIRGRERKH